MSQTLLLALVVAAGAACLLHMWWQNRRARRADSSTGQAPGADVEVLRARQAQLSVQIAQHEEAASRAEAADRAPADTGAARPQH